MLWGWQAQGQHHWPTAGWAPRLGQGGDIGCPEAGGGDLAASTAEQWHPATCKI